jgi:hypothetical protein
MRIGPEASASLGRTRALGGIRVQSGWRKARAGLALAEIPLGPVRFTASGGVEWETGEHPGAYGGLSAYWRF